MDVFINCPFDDKYILRRYLLFAIVYLGHKPRIASEDTDCARNRLEKITQLIKTSDVAVHDISRMVSSKKGEFSRFNLPFELGLDIGLRSFCSSKSDKKILILEANKYDYQKSISDIVGYDIECHNDDPEVLIAVIRDWFVNNDLTTSLDSPNRIYLQYMFFYADLYSTRQDSGYTMQELEKIKDAEFIREIENWLSQR